MAKTQKLQLLPIEKGIPIPEIDHYPKYRKPARFQYGLRRLEVGDSVFIPGKARVPMRAMSDIKQATGYIFTYRVYHYDDGEQKGCRIWRVL